MRYLNKHQVEQMAAKTDLTLLRLHFEGNEDEGTLFTAQNLLAYMRKLIIYDTYIVDGRTVSLSAAAEKIWKSARICTNDDYQLGQTENI